MSYHRQPENLNTISPNLVAFILTSTFVVTALLVFSAMAPSNSQPGTEDRVEVALAEPTATPLPSATLVPLPTQTPLPSATPTTPITPTAAPTSTPQIVAAVPTGDAASVSYDPALVAQGEKLFAQCVACHGPDARGLPNLGKDLVKSEFVAGLTDEALSEFIKTGRPIWDPLNTTGIDMPGKGGNPALTADDIHAIVAYLRTLAAQNSGQAQAAPVSHTTTAYDPAIIAEGEQLFMQCAACHGPDARGLPNLGKDLVKSEFVAGLTDEALSEFIKTGRPIWDPLNTTGIDMPGKGGNPALTDEQIAKIIAYLRSLAAGSS